MKFNAGCWRLRLIVLVIGASLLNACATVSSERVVGTCPPLEKYDAGFQARAAEEMLQLPEGSLLVEMLADYAAMREQARACLIP